MLDNNNFELNDLTGKTLIGWLYYDPEYVPYGMDIDFGATVNNRCYFYPRYMIWDKKIFNISSKLMFPEVGRVQIKITDNQTSDMVCKKFGNVVQVKFNKIPMEQINSNNKYYLRYNASYGKNSEIWLEAFDGRGFYQVIDANNNIDYIRRNRTIMYHEKIYTTEIILKLIDGYYGPFKYTKKDENVLLQGSELEQYYITKYTDIEQNILSIENNEDLETLSIISKTNIASASEPNNKYDFIDDEIIIKQFMNLIQKDTSNNFTKSECSRIKDAMLKAEKNNKKTSLEITPERRQRMISIINNMNENCLQTDDFIKELLEDQDVCAKLSTIVIKEHYNTLLAHIKDRQEYISIWENAQSDAKKIIDEASEKAKALYEDAEKQKALTDSQTSSMSKAKIGQLEKEIQDRELELETKNEELRQLCEKLKVVSKIEELRAENRAEEKILAKQKERWSEEQEKQRKINNNLKENFDKILEEFKKAERVAAEKLKDSFLADVMRRLDYDSLPEEKNTPFDVSLLSKEVNRDVIISNIQSYITDVAGREVTTNDVANYLICITQGFITTFAGNPGTGKTSLCYILANALGLCSNDIDKCRYTELSVERGWTSHKDYIGYHNPLSRQMEKSNYEMFRALELLDSENDDGEHAPYIVLLDEANLSPLEHYWAPFLKMCDFDTSKNRTINLGGNHVLHVPEHLRFLATVNFDHTTEELSPRFLDRSFIVTLEPTSVISDTEKIQLENCEQIISFDNLKTAFMPSEEEQMNEDNAQKWSAICTIFQQNGMAIMPRNQKMVQSYCAIACSCMITDTLATKYAPLDYAVSQKILPTIFGMGDDYERLIKQLTEECKDMPLTMSHLTRMKKGALDMGLYQFFGR